MMEQASGDDSNRPRVAPLIGVSLAWAALSLLVALNRSPFDDEWFSITLTRLSPERFWSSLSRDVHPATISLLDRALLAHGAIWIGRAVRVAVSTTAIVLTARTLRSALGTPLLFITLGMFHPIVFMYGAAVRWYPFLFLAQALRFSAVFNRDIPGRRPYIALGVGNLLGLQSGYVDIPFALLDSLFFAHSRRGRRARVAAAGVAIVSIAASLLVLAGIPEMHLAARLLHRRPSQGFSGVPPFVTWALLGLGGEAFFSLLFFVTALVAGVGLLAALFRTLSNRWPSPFAVWMLTTTGLWLAATRWGVWHPRYSLLFWMILTALLAELVRGGHLLRALTAVTAFHLTATTIATSTQRFFLKTDLNEMTRTDCEDLLRIPNNTLIVAPYIRTADQLSRTCHVQSNIAIIPIRHQFPNVDEQLSGLRRSLDGSPSVLMVSVPANGSSMEGTTRRVRGILQERCTLDSDWTVGQSPFSDLKRRLTKRDLPWKYRGERWTCPAEGGIR